MSTRSFVFTSDNTMRSSAISTTRNPSTSCPTWTKWVFFCRRSSKIPRCLVPMETRPLKTNCGGSDFSGVPVGASAAGGETCRRARLNGLALRSPCHVSAVVSEGMRSGSGGGNSSRTCSQRSVTTAEGCRACRARCHCHAANDTPAHTTASTIDSTGASFMDSWIQCTNERTNLSLVPCPLSLRIPSETTAETWQGLLRANPFSRARRHVSPPAAEAPTGTPEKPLPPQFVFKGRVSMGTKQRGILEDRRQKKTHFVQVGQDVLGFRVVEIAEDRIVLSDVKTNERVDIPLASKAAAETEKSSEGSQKP